MLIAKEVSLACFAGVEVAIVVGGRNFFCGDTWVTSTGFDRCTAYQIGKAMIGTIPNTFMDKNLWGWNEEDTEAHRPLFPFSKLCSPMHLPLTVPRRLTIPLVDEENWSKCGYITAKDVLELVEEHILKGEIVEKFWRGQVGTTIGKSSAALFDSHNPPSGLDTVKVKPKRDATWIVVIILSITSSATIAYGIYRRRR
ncbi:uncharacterized protein LOC127239622 [Andrographis paniculata]|uniref:uncharacterized protein LOC127239622 n=1 Tax=Andrographis paniculata TaxID=175694 RepID=UPI0021E8CB6C|nr:uncharacterized protein LOC127239622 [Andrographis paniculata]